MDTDPRIQSINNEIQQIREQIKKQETKIQESALIQKLIEWRKLKKLQREHENKLEFRKKLIENIKRSSSRKRKVSNRYNVN